jgi:hypothetical protein
MEGEEGGVSENPKSTKPGPDVPLLASDRG